MWTLDELLDRVSAALTAEYSGAPNGRVRDVPDKRAVRWYATTGLVDRPSAMRGRTALYENRHLLQLVALKRLQSEGRTLADIQAELAGATEATLAAIARVPGHLLEVGDAAPAEAVRPRFWAAPVVPAAGPAPTDPAPTPAWAPASAPPTASPTDAPPAAAPAAPPTAAPAAAPAVPPATAPPAQPVAARAVPPAPAPAAPLADASVAPPAAPPVAAIADASIAPGASAPPADQPAPLPAAPPPPPTPLPAPPTAPPTTPPGTYALTGVALPGGAVLLVPGTPTAADRAEIATAARPLLDLLAARGLLDERDQP
ncbi:MerR family transcriptional regulator [Lentzea cavernae]|uniref:MerR family transcriptional regulator n=1 Tax=Lentzea cavernae TaxID=2020703 RepID=UPI001E319025|nr:MerR family transcriptional regulator [Lentzea cavernae]